MKKTMKLVAILAILVVLGGGLVGCKDLSGGTKGIGHSVGVKTDRTLTVDATGKKLKDGNIYGRYIKNIGDYFDTPWITTTIEISGADSILTSDASGEEKNVVVGYAFDLNENKDGTYDMVLFGLQVKKGYAYLERYTGFNLKEDFEGTSADLGGTCTKIWNTNVFDPMGTDAPKPDDSGDYKFTVKVDQPEQGTYAFYVKDNNNPGSNFVEMTPKEDNEGAAEALKGKIKFDANDNKAKYKEDGVDQSLVGYAHGRIMGYINCPKGTKVKATYKTEAKSLPGGDDKKYLYEEVDY